MDQASARLGLVAFARVKRHIRQNLRVLLLHGLQLIGIQAESLQNGWGDLQGFDGTGDSFGIEAWV
jgi:hypothetical protein